MIELRTMKSHNTSGYFYRQTDSVPSLIKLGSTTRLQSFEHWYKNYLCTVNVKKMTKNKPRTVEEPLISLRVVKHLSNVLISL